MQGQLAQGLARFVDIEEVTGSNPVLPTTDIVMRSGGRHTIRYGAPSNDRASPFAPTKFIRVKARVVVTATGHRPAPHQNLSGVVSNQIMELKDFGARVQIQYCPPIY